MSQVGQCRGQILLCTHTVFHWQGRPREEDMSSARGSNINVWEGCQVIGQRVWLTLVQRAAHPEILLLLLVNRTAAQSHYGSHVVLLNGGMRGVFERTRQTAQTLTGFKG
jgi:hypothetical protein